MLNRLRAVCRTAVNTLRSDRGSSLPEVMVSVIVSAVTMSVVAGSVIAVGTLNSTMVQTGVAASESAYTDLRWSNDVRAAVAISATDSTSVTFTVPGTAGKCSTSAWGSGAGGKGLVVTTVAYPTIGGVACTGAPSAPTTEQIVASSTELVFTYRNPGGREINFVAGVATLIAANRPSTVQYDAWESKTVGAASLRTTAAAGTGWERPIISTRSASTILASGAGFANAAIRAVPGGNLIATNYLVGTAAGTGVVGSANGPAATATFNQASGLATDVDGNVYVADTAGHKIRKITVSGAVTTLAGSGVNGFKNDIGPSAVFSLPADAAVDAAGTVYVADTGNHLIRRITADGVVSTLAGAQGVAGAVDGTGGAARLNGPSSIVVSAAGVIYFSEASGNRIRKVTAAGVVTTIAGSGVAGFADGTGAAAQFNGPEGIEVDSASNLYVADTVNNRVRKVTAAGVVTTIAGSGVAGMVDGAALSAQFSAPRGVSIDTAGALFVADTANWRIRRLAAGQVSTAAGKAVAGSLDATGATATFTQPYDVDVSPAPGGRILVADRSGYKIRFLQ